MVENSYFASIETPRLQVELQQQWRTASLRYFTRDTAFTQRVRTVTGLEVPSESSRAAAHSTDVGEVPLTLLAWRSPTETILLTRDVGLFETLQIAAATLDDGCMVDHCGGLLVWRVRGEAVADLVSRKAGHGALPAIGEARRSRFAEISVLIVRVHVNELLFIVDRIYAPHLIASIRASAVDL